MFGSASMLSSFCPGVIRTRLNRGVGQRERHGLARRPAPCGPSPASSRLRRSGATMSITFFASASRFADRDTVADGLLDPISLRPRCCAIVRANVAVKFSIFWPITPLMSLPPSLHRMRRADCRPRRHRGDVRRFSNESPGRRGARARRRDVNDHRQRRGERSLDDPLRGARAGRPACRARSPARSRRRRVARSERIVDKRGDRGIDRAVNR